MLEIGLKHDTDKVTLSAIAENAKNSVETLTTLET